VRIQPDVDRLMTRGHPAESGLSARLTREPER
jgi:hypothetical protein